MGQIIGKIVLESGDSYLFDGDLFFCDFLLDKYPVGVYITGIAGIPLKGILSILRKEVGIWRITIIRRRLLSVPAVVRSTQIVQRRSGRSWLIG